MSLLNVSIESEVRSDRSRLSRLTHEEEEAQEYEAWMQRQTEMSDKDER